MHARHLSGIIGKDNRVQVTDMSYPHTAIGQLQYTEGANGGRYLCTGTLFTERHVLTCAHCIYDKETNEFNRDWHFVPGLHGNQRPFGSIACDSNGHCYDAAPCVPQLQCGGDACAAACYHSSGTANPRLIADTISSTSTCLSTWPTTRIGTWRL